MKIINSLHKRGLVCACGCGDELPVKCRATKMNNKYYKMYHAKIYRLHIESVRWIRSIAWQIASVNANITT